ncbi:MAG: ATP-binding protein [Nitrospira sp.]|nr:ATP-binding protein [Nitrospira sp.]
MKILLLLTSSDEIINLFESAGSDEYIVLATDNLKKGGDLILTEQVHIITVDVTISENISSWIRRYGHIPGLIWLGILPQGMPPQDMPKKELEYQSIFHGTLHTPLVPESISREVSNILNKHKLSGRPRHQSPLLSQFPAPFPDIYQDRYNQQKSYLPSFEPLEKAVALARTFTASFDLDKLANLFLDGVMDVLAVSRASILLYDPEDEAFRIKAFRGLHPDITSRLSLNSDSGMVLWLSSRGRILRRDKSEEDFSHPNILERALDEMETLQAIVSIPVMYEGKLICILNLDYKITGESYDRTELEKLFILSNYFGKSVEDVYNHRKICYQKNYIQKILERMGSGVITINDGGKIIIFNPRAGEILKVSGRDMLGKSTQSLPEPLSNLITETIKEGKVCRKHEIIIEKEGIFLEVDSYGLYGPKGELIGGVLLLDDISAKKELSMEKKKGDTLQTLNSLAGRMAHELRNPLVAVRTFTQLLKERFNDPEFQDFFYNTVTEEVDKLNNLIEKLVAFVNPIEYKFEELEISEIMDNCLEALLKEYKISDIRLIKNYRRTDIKVRADKFHIVKAFSYILQNSLDGISPDGTLTINFEYLPKDANINVTIKDDSRVIPLEDLENIFDPFYSSSVREVWLGFPLSHKIIEDHGGKIHINSSPGQGTLISVRLPVITQ